MNKMTILIKGKVNEAKRKVIHKLGGYDEFDMHLALNPPMPARITHLDLQTIACTLLISMDAIENDSIEVYEREICKQMARELAKLLMDYTEFTLCGPMAPDSYHYGMTGEIKIFRPEERGKINLENYHGPALRKETDDEEVDRGGDPQP